MSFTVDNSSPVTAESRLVATPYTDRCRALWARGEHALFGVSPGNSFFSAERVAALATWADQFFDRVDIVYADTRLDAMFVALGYSPEHARKRAHKDVQGVRRRIRRGLGTIRPVRARFRVSALSEFAELPAYRQVLDIVEPLLRSDERAWRAGVDMVRDFLRGRLPQGSSPTPEQMRVGLGYLTAELPFFVDTARVVRAGSSVACHHAVTPLTEVLYADGNGLRAAGRQAYLTVRPPDPRLDTRTPAATAEEGMSL